MDKIKNLYLKIKNFLFCCRNKKRLNTLLENNQYDEIYFNNNYDGKLYFNHNEALKNFDTDIIYEQDITENKSSYLDISTENLYDNLNSF